MSKLFKLDTTKPARDLIERSAQILVSGGLVVFPTETFYGIAVDSQNPDGLTKLAILKDREAEKPFPLIISSVDQLNPLVGDLSTFVQKITDFHWPGPLTLVMEAKPGVNPKLISDNNGIGIRLSSWPIARALANALGRAITATSANLAGKPPAKTVAELDPAVIDAVDLVLDGGPTPGGLASTVLDVRCDPPKVLRQGPIHIPGAVQ
jgi:L-threonylcarbamoyladenylate synthase